MDVKVRDDVARLNITFPYGEVPKAFQVAILCLTLPLLSSISLTLCPMCASTLSMSRVLY